MAFKVNYGLERAERNRAKQAKKEAKLKARTANSDGAADESDRDSGATDETAAPVPEEK